MIACMSANNPIRLTAGLLGRFSLWLGVVAAPFYGAAYVLLTSRPRAGHFVLSPVLPEVGLALALVGLALAAAARVRSPRSCLAGAALNAAALLPCMLLG
jgi:hypothetical protein